MSFYDWPCLSLKQVNSSQNQTISMRMTDAIKKLSSTISGIFMKSQEGSPIDILKFASKSQAATKLSARLSRLIPSNPSSELNSVENCCSFVDNLIKNLMSPYFDECLTDLRLNAGYDPYIKIHELLDPLNVAVENYMTKIC